MRPCLLLILLLAACGRERPLPIYGEIPAFQLVNQKGRTFDRTSFWWTRRDASADITVSRKVIRQLALHEMPRDSKKSRREFCPVSPDPQRDPECDRRRLAAPRILADPKPQNRVTPARDDYGV